MRAFEVTMNGRRVLTAGTGSLLWANITDLASDPPEPGDLTAVNLGGQEPVTGILLAWEAPSLGLGDEVTFRVVNVETVDPPHDRFASDGDGNMSPIP
jgi:hypothetical protein